MENITQLLSNMAAGDKSARDALFTSAYQELRYLARARLRDGGRNTELDATSLVSECYLRIVRVGKLPIEDRRGFFCYASRVMRSVIVDTARGRLAERRGGGLSPLTLTTELVEDLANGEQTSVRIHEALLELEQAGGRLAQVAEMRYFGYNEREIAEALGITERTVQRDWEKARAILRAVLKQMSRAPRVLEILAPEAEEDGPLRLAQLGRCFDCRHFLESPANQIEILELASVSLVDGFHRYLHRCVRASRSRRE